MPIEEIPAFVAVKNPNISYLIVWSGMSLRMHFGYLKKKTNTPYPNKLLISLAKRNNSY
jgi:hypothetical protein